MSDNKKKPENKAKPARPGNPRAQKLKKQNQQLVAANKALRADRDRLKALHKKAKDKGSAASMSDSEALKLLETERERFRVELHKKDAIIVMMRDEAERARAEVRSYANSTSWKMTSPVRWFINFFRRG